MKQVIAWTILALGLAGCSEDAPAPSGPVAITEQRILAADSEPGNWMVHGRTYDEQRFSPLTQITDKNVSELGLAWHHDFATNRGMEATPLVIDGVIYTTGAWSIVYALDGKTGELLWEFDPQVPRAKAIHACCDVVNRGVAAWNGKLYVGTLDGRLIAIDPASGSEIWSVETFDPDTAYTITGAPRVVKGNVLIGNGGGELGVRGYVTAYDAETGAQKWRFYTVPGNPADGFENDAMKMAAKTWTGEWWTLGGGGTAWDSMAYDADLDLLYIGVGNGSPWNPSIRSPQGGDNLFLSSILAVHPDTGDYVWHFQTTPEEAWDYTATQHMILAELEIEGKARKVIMQAPKNGFFYVLDRETGEFISGQNFVPITWASGLDESGRPILNPEARYDKTGKPTVVLPSPAGAHSWNPMSFSPNTGLVYIPAIELPMVYTPVKKFAYREGRWNTGVDGAAGAFPDAKPARDGIKAATRGHLAAWDPVTQSEAWRVQYDETGNGGVLSTAGNLVFQGLATSQLKAYAADTGKELWSFGTQTGVVAPPITYMVEGEQYIAVMAGWGGIIPLALPSYLTSEASMPNVSRLLVFKAGGEDALPAPDYEPIAWSKPPGQYASAEAIAHGKQTYFAFCGNCHGDSAMGTGFVPDLRRSYVIDEADTWTDIVLGGALSDAGMVAFDDFLSDEDAQAVRAYVIDRANFAYANIQAGLSQ